MSKHIFDSKFKGETHNVQIGWDKPLQNYYYVVSSYIDFEGEKHLDDPILSNIYDLEKRSLIEISTLLEEHGIVIPSGLIASVEEDMKRNAVNEVKFYD